MKGRAPEAPPFSHEDWIKAQGSDEPRSLIGEGAEVNLIPCRPRQSWGTVLSEKLNVDETLPSVSKYVTVSYRQLEIRRIDERLG
jgi:hypothetical protein